MKQFANLQEAVESKQPFYTGAIDFYYYGNRFFIKEKSVPTSEPVDVNQIRTYERGGILYFDVMELLRQVTRGMMTVSELEDADKETLKYFVLTFLTGWLPSNCREIEPDRVFNFLPE